MFLQDIIFIENVQCSKNKLLLISTEQKRKSWNRASRERERKKEMKVLKYSCRSLSYFHAHNIINLFTLLSLSLSLSVIWTNFASLQVRSISTKINEAKLNRAPFDRITGLERSNSSSNILDTIFICEHTTTFDPSTLVDTGEITRGCARSSIKVLAIRGQWFSLYRDSGEISHREIVGNTFEINVIV